MDQALLDGVIAVIPAKISMSILTLRYVSILAIAYGNGKLFNLKRKPWIMPDEVDVTTVVKVIDTCPSGALKYRHK